MPRQCRLHGHLRGRQITNLADHDDVGILPHQRAHAALEVHTDLRLHLHLIKRRLHHLNRVFDGTHVHLGCGERLERGIQCRRLAGTGRPGHQNNAVRAGDHGLPARQIVIAKPEIAEVAQEHFGIKNTHDNFFTERRRHRRDAQFNFLAFRRHGLDATVLRAALLNDFHARQELHATHHRGEYHGRNLIDLMQHAIDTKAHHA